MIDVLEQRSSPYHDTADNSEETIVSRFERRVAARPDALAVVTDHVSLTYRALDLRASGIAAALASLSSQRHWPVAILVKDDAARVAAMLGVLKANRIFIPLAPNSPEKWVGQVIEDSGTVQIIVDSATHALAGLVDAGRIAVLDVERLAGSSEPFVADRSVSPDDAAYIVYTSGSTGLPKGVVNSHRSLMRRAEIRHKESRLGRGDRFANLRSTGVSAGVNDALLPLLAGGCLYPFDLHGHGLQKLAPWLIAHEINYVAFSGSLLRTWLGSLPDTTRFPALKFVWMGGEPLYARDVIRLSRHLEGDWRIGHTYSSTECGTITAQVFSASRLPDPGDDGILSVGSPVDGVEIFIQDATGATSATSATGATGEIVIRSRFLAHGYWNNPDLTAEVFQADSLDPAIRIFQTGDLGRFRSDGTLEHMGRKGRRIRLHGYTIEPFEVECELIRQPGVTDAVVFLHEGAAGEEPCLVGYIVAPPETSPPVIRKGLAGRLPSYMVPSHIVVLGSFPIARSGKIDRAALPPPYSEDPHRATSTSTDDHEHELCKIWQEVLSVPKVGIDDDFFELGGTSLQALMLFASIEARLGYSLSPTTIVQAPTIARLAKIIRETAGITETRSLVPLRSSGTGAPLFLVHNKYCFVMYYRHLLSALKSDRPVFGLQPPPLDGKHDIPRTIESMAADYVAEIRRIQPHGPYFLAGHSFGGLVSFEIAQQLVRDGERVNFLALIDTALRDASIEPWSPALGAARVSHRIYSIFLKLQWIRNALLMRQRDLWIRLGCPIPYEHRPAFYERLCVRAGRVYVPKPYIGHVTMFSSAGNSEWHRARWGALAGGGLTVLEVPAGHNDMVLPPYSQLLAEQFDACLDGH